MVYACVYFTELWPTRLPPTDSKSELPPQPPNKMKKIKHWSCFIINSPVNRLDSRFPSRRAHVSLDRSSIFWELRYTHHELWKAGGNRDHFHWQDHWIKTAHVQPTLCRDASDLQPGDSGDGFLRFATCTSRWVMELIIKLSLKIRYFWRGFA